MWCSNIILYLFITIMIVPSAKSTSAECYYWPWKHLEITSLCGWHSISEGIMYFYSWTILVSSQMKENCSFESESLEYVLDWNTEYSFWFLRLDIWEHHMFSIIWHMFSKGPHFRSRHSSSWSSLPFLEVSITILDPHFDNDDMSATQRRKSYMVSG